MDDYEQLKAKVEQLKKNREQVPLETLKTKYKKPYEALLAQIKELATGIMHEQLLKGIAIRQDDKGEELISTINQTIAEQQKPGGIMKRASQAVFKHYDVDEFKALVEEMRITIRNLWITYWQEFCCIYATPENFEEPYPTPRIYNELTDEFQNEDGTWAKHPEWKAETAIIITAGACRLLAGAKREKESRHG